MGKTNPLNEKDLAEFVKMAKTQELSENSWTVNIADIKTDTWGLTVNNPNTIEEIDNRTPQEIIKEIEQLEQQKAINAPKVVFADKVEGSTDTLSMSEYAKIINWGPNKLRLQLSKHRILMEEPRKNQPFQKYINSGYFKTTQKVNEHSGRLYVVTLVTGKGQLWINKKIEGWI